MATLPGVNVTLADGYYSAQDEGQLRDRILIIAEPDSTITTGWKATPATNVPYNPTFYRTESAVAADWGAGSNAHIAFVNALKAGASNIYISCVDSSVSNYWDATAGRTHTSGDNIKEAEFAKALEFADIVNPDIIVAHGFYANDWSLGSTDRVANFAEKLAQKCYDLTENVNPCMGVIGVYPCAEYTEIAGTFSGDYTAAEVSSYINRLIEAADTDPITSPTPLQNVVNALTGATDPIDRYISIVVGDIIVKNQPASAHPETGAGTAGDVVYVSGAAATAGLIFATPYERSVTRAKFPNVEYVAYNLSKTQRLALLGDAIAGPNFDGKANPIIVDVDNQAVMGDGYTMAQPDSDGNESVYNRISTVRIVNDLVKSTSRVVEGFIGMQASTARLNSITTMLRTVYNAYRAAGVLEDYTFNMRYSKSTYTLTVELTIIPFGEIREVNITVAVQMQ